MTQPNSVPRIHHAYVLVGADARHPYFVPFPIGEFGRCVAHHLPFAEAEVDVQSQDASAQANGEVLVQSLRVTVENDAVGYVGAKEEIDIEFAVILVLTFALGKGDVRRLRVDGQQIEESDPVANQNVLTVVVEHRRRHGCGFTLLLQVLEQVLVVEDQIAHVANERLEDVRT